MFDEVVVTSWIDLRDRLEGFSSTAIFRGQSDALWKLETSLERRCRKPTVGKDTRRISNTFSSRRRRG